MKKQTLAQLFLIAGLASITVVFQGCSPMEPAAGLWSADTIAQSVNETNTPSTTDSSSGAISTGSDITPGNPGSLGGSNPMVMQPAPIIQIIVETPSLPAPTLPAFLVPQGKCSIVYGGNVESSFDGVNVTRDLCEARFSQFLNEAAFNPFPLSCIWDGGNCGQRGPIAVATPAPAPAPEPLDICIINYGGNTERSFNAQPVTQALCKERFAQFLSNSAFDNLSLSCSFGAVSCGLRGPVAQVDVLGSCMINYGGNIEASFDGQMVTKALCQARFSQFVSNTAFNPYQLSCRFNGSDICGERGPVQ